MNDRLLTAIGTTLVAVTLGGVMLVLGSAATITLIAHRLIEVHDRAGVDPSQTQVVGMLHRGEEVAVVGCEDLKSSFAFEVVLPDGNKGYVLTGDFDLRREPPWSSPKQPTSLSCPLELLSGSS
jgi:hypothetical protein